MKTYNSIHEYLNEAFANVSNPSNEEIAREKAQYWRNYLDVYQKKRRTKVKEYTLGFDRQCLQLIHQRRESLSVSQFLYRCVFGVLEGQHFMMDSKLIGAIHQNQMEMIAQLEELLENDTPLITEAFIEKMEALEQQITKLKSGGN